MSAHTPGPWHLDRSTLISAYVMAENGRHVVSLPVGAGWWHSPKSEWDNSQDGADARLIAAAPDLLRELRSSPCPGGGWTGMPDEVADRGATIQDCLNAGVCGCGSGAAVAKATGAA
jgi:hypothetical protein